MAPDATAIRDALATVVENADNNLGLLSFDSNSEALCKQVVLVSRTARCYSLRLRRNVMKRRRSEAERQKRRDKANKEYRQKRKELKNEKMQRMWD